ncbi:glycosyltransferase family 2 protein [Bradyrhizobium sp. sBnM-33]|uniref:glycosyltransferase family 2 protein n=1 Tax=Bradyrhizobium sp. sBnM-33 TaxID=2831780 RepID=UPI001BCAE11A|nr:glycosyltransferase family 2 protein [Bradyrhizobium sp. sBnM-33]WOH53721.1 glycosyltransferase family 2 protein [Bradyrhizobium sp. sBnM-33]
MKLLVAIVNFRVPDLVIDCLRSVEDELSRVPETCVAICENGSGDDSAQRIQQAINENGWSSWCTLTTLDVNQGFTGGNNVLIAPALQSCSPPEYVLLLNPDTIVRPNAFASLIDFMDHHRDVGIAGSRLENPDGTPQRSAFRFQSPLGEFEAGARIGPITRMLKNWVVAPPVVDHEMPTDWVSGASMIVRREVFEQTGLLDEGFFTYYDDIDFCFNARKQGWSTWYVPASRVVHLVGQSTGINATPRRLPPYLLQARRRYFLKNYGPFYAAMADAGVIAGLVLSRLRALLTGHNDNSPPHLLADSIRYSVFFMGFRMINVKLPNRI